MESNTLHLSIDYVGSSGVVLSPEQKAALQTSLVILQSENKFEKVYFWGKILGIKDDYYIAQGVTKDEMVTKKTFYSKDCVHWGLLPVANEDMRNQAQLVKGRFIGDPAFEFEHVEMKKVGEGEDATEEEETVTIKEEDRLAAIISEVDLDVKIVPRGAFIKTPCGTVVSNRCFEGLTVIEAAKACNYMHFKEPENLTEKSLLQKANLEKSIDFMDCLEDDIPKGSWSLQFERGSGLMTLRSLLWMGYVFYHIPGSKQFGSVYWGTGEKNMDLAFML